MTTDNPLNSQLRTAHEAVAAARSVREYHRKRTDRWSQQRTTDLEVAQMRLRDAMRPLRSAIARFPYTRFTEISAEDRERIYQASQAIQVERRKLHKMKPPNR